MRNIASPSQKIDTVASIPRLRRLAAELTRVLVPHPDRNGGRYALAASHADVALPATPGRAVFSQLQRAEQAQPEVR
jgi:hypothetical protein